MARAGFAAGRDDLRFQISHQGFSSYLSYRYADFFHGDFVPFGQDEARTAVSVKDYFLDLLTFEECYAVKTCSCRRPCGPGGPSFSWFGAFMHFLLNHLVFFVLRLLPLGIELAIIAPAAALVGTKSALEVCPSNADQGLAVIRFVQTLLGAAMVSAGLTSFVLVFGRCMHRCANTVWPFLSWFAFGAMPLFIFGLSGWFIDKFYLLGNVGNCDALLFDYASGLAIFYIAAGATLMAYFTYRCLCATRYWVIAGPNPADKIASKSTEMSTVA